MACDDKFGYHEVLHTVSVIGNLWENEIIGHGLFDHRRYAMDIDQVRLLKEAEVINTAIADFYQLLAQAIDTKFPKEVTGE